jgi:hypothetical protein
MKNNRSVVREVCVVFLILTVLSMMLATGCASSNAVRVKRTNRSSKDKKRGESVLVEASQKKVPSWITKIPEDDNYYYYVGTSADAQSFDEGKKNALADALSQVVATIGIKVTAKSTVEEKYLAEQYETTLQSELFTEGKAKLQDAELKEIYYEKYENPDGSIFFRVWVLLKYGKEDIRREQARLEEILQLKYREITALENQGKKQEQKGELFDAVNSYVNASVASLKIDDGEVFFDRNLVKASEALTQIQLQKSGEEQIGFVGEPLQKPLVLKIFYRRGDVQVPLAGVPVIFSYRVPKEKSAGYKQIVTHTATDENGTASVRIDMVYEVNENNRVGARIDLQPLISRLDAAAERYPESVDMFRDIAAKKRTSFYFASDTYARLIKTAVYFLQLDKDGSPLAKPVAAPVFYDVLYKKKFLIRILDIKPEQVLGKSTDQVLETLENSAGKNILRILYGDIQITGYDEISAFQTAKAEAVVYLFDRETNTVIRTWRVSRSGTGKTREDASRNALVETGRSLGETISSTMP